MKAHPSIPALGSLLVIAVTASAAELRVPADHATIQGAVNAASSGDTIHISAGVYTEQIVIFSKELTLLGEPGTILRATPGMQSIPPSESSWRAVLFVQFSPQVTLRGLTFQGDQLADQQGGRGLLGAAFWDAGATVEDCRFTGFREAMPGTSSGVALILLNDLPGAPFYTVRVAGNTIVDSYVGIHMIGAPDRLSYEFVIENNTISGVGPNATNADLGLRGMDLGDGIRGVVRKNRISGFSYDGAGALNPFGWGIIAIGRGYPDHQPFPEPLRFENNEFVDNNIHMVLIEANGSSVTGNSFRGSGPGRREAGVWATGESLRISENSFRDMPFGVRAGGLDPEFGLTLGLAANAQVTNNRFRDVTTPLEVQPQATATEEGSLLYPFPAPEPRFDAALKISWLSYDDAWSLQRSDNLEDWTGLDLSVIVQDGRSMVIVPMDEKEAYFRLVEKAQP